MALADDFQAVLDSLPPDWTQLELDLRIFDEDRYVEAAALVVQVNAMPYSQNDWHWRLRVASRFGHAAAAETVSCRMPAFAAVQRYQTVRPYGL